MDKYEVIVGNIGTVYSGTDRNAADAKFEAYVELASSGMGRAAGETVTMMRDGEIYMETEA